MKLLLKFLPKEWRDALDVVQRLLGRLDTHEERKEAIASLIRMQRSDGYISVIEWTKWGSQIGIIGKRKK